MTAPTLSTAGPNSRACAVFDGVDNFMDTRLPLSDFISDDACYIIFSCVIDAVTLTDSNPFDNHCLIGDDGQQIGIYAKSDGASGLIIQAANFNGSADAAESALAETVIPLVISLRHEGGAIYLRVNNGTAIPIASGDTSALTGSLRLAMSAVGTNADVKIFECATFDCVPVEGTRDGLEQNFMSWIGAEALDEPYINAALRGVGTLSISGTVV